MQLCFDKQLSGGWSFLPSRSIHAFGISSTAPQWCLPWKPAVSAKGMYCPSWKPIPVLPESNNGVLFGFYQKFCSILIFRQQHKPIAGIFAEIIVFDPDIAAHAPLVAPAAEHLECLVVFIETDDNEGITRVGLPVGVPVPGAGK